MFATKTGSDPLASTYAAFAASMIAAEASEVAAIAKIDAYQFANAIVAPNADNTAATVAPRKAA